MRLTNAITIDRRPNTVFAYLADLENLPSWNYAIRKTRKVTAGPIHIGSRFHQVRTIPAHREESLEVIEFEEGRKLTIRGTLNTLPAQLSYELQPVGIATVLTNTVDLSTSGPLSLLAPIATRQIKSAVAANLDTLKKILEAT
jgi:Polyketide cyclase / dehydrase and lipid transport